MPRLRVADQRRAQAHLERLAKKHKVGIRWRKRRWTGFEAHVTTRLVFVGRPTTSLRYMAALHELGHVLVHRRREADPREEAAAWQWAVKRADPQLLETVTPKEWEKIGWSWHTHLYPPATAWRGLH